MPACRPAWLQPGTNILAALKIDNMKYFFTNILMVFTLLISQGTYPQNSISPDDLNTISGEWNGTLTYVDYGTNKPFKMPANASVVPGKISTRFNS